MSDKPQADTKVPISEFAGVVLEYQCPKCGGMGYFPERALAICQACNGRGRIDTPEGRTLRQFIVFG